MPYRTGDGNKMSGILCQTCRSNISGLNNYIECDSCENTYHLKCEGIIGQNINRVSSSDQYNCKTCKSDNQPINNSDESTKRKANSPQNADHINKRQNKQNTPPRQMDDKIMNELKLFLQQTITTSIKSSNEELKAIIVEVKENQNSLTDKFNEINEKIIKITKEHTTFTTEVSDITKQQDQHSQTINKLEANIDQFNQQNLSNNIIIGGLPNNVEIKTAIVNIIDTLKINCTIDDILDAYYLRNKNMNNTENSQLNNSKVKNHAPLLLIKLKNYQIKTEFMEKKKQRGTLFVREISINSPSERIIYFRDHVTPYKNNLFKDCLELKDAYKIRFLWMKGSEILIRKHENSKVYSITSRNDLNNLKSLLCNETAQSLSPTTRKSTEA